MGGNLGNDVFQMVGGNMYQSSSAIFNSHLYFQGSNLSTGNVKMFKVDSSDNITIVSNLSNNINAYDTITNLTIFNGDMYFAGSLVGVIKLYKINTSGVITQLSNIGGNSSVSDLIPDSSGQPFVVDNTNGFIYFIGTPWDSLNASVYGVFSINTSGQISKKTATSAQGALGTGSSSDVRTEPGAMFIFNGFIYFIGYDNQGTIQLFKL
jgi:hypothetical protein